MESAETGKKHHILIVGAGPGGLTAAMILAHRGFRVTVFEAEDQVGGRNASIRLGPYTFDVGPTFLMLNSILDEVFHESGASTADLLRMKKLDPIYRLQFQDRYIEAAADPARMKQEIARAFPGKEHLYDRFLAQERIRFERLFPCLQKSYHKASTLFSMDLLRAVPHLALGQSLYDVMIRCFEDPQLALSFTFQSKYLGMSPWDCPGLFSIIPYIEHSFGIFHPVGGLSRISEAMAGVAERNGAVIHLKTPVERILTRDGAARGVRLKSGDIIEGDEVIINADFGYAATHLFDPGVLRKYTPDTLTRKKYSCSTFMLYLGLDKLYDLPHHTIFFAKDYKANLEAISGGRDVSRDFSFYIRNASCNDSTLAPKDHSAVYVLVPVANLRSGMNWEEHKSAFRNRVLDAMEQRAGMTGLRNHIQQEHIITPQDWQDDYRVYAGATFNMGHQISQMTILRPRNKFEEVDHCYLVGGGTHPGSGLPTIYESGRIAANLISRACNIPFVSGNLVV